MMTIIVPGVLNEVYNGKTKQRKLTPDELARLVDHLNTTPSMSWKEHAQWVEKEFGVKVPAKYCYQLFMQS